MTTILTDQQRIAALESRMESFAAVLTFIAVMGIFLACTPSRRRSQVILVQDGNAKVIP